MHGRIIRKTNSSTWKFTLYQNDGVWNPYLLVYYTFWYSSISLANFTILATKIPEKNAFSAEANQRLSTPNSSKYFALDFSSFFSLFYFQYSYRNSRILIILLGLLGCSTLCDMNKKLITSYLWQIHQVFLWPNLWWTKHTNYIRGSEYWPFD